MWWLLEELFFEKPKKANNTHRNNKYMLSTIITISTNIYDIETTNYGKIKTNELKKNVLKHLYGRCDIGLFDKFSH